MDIFIHPTAVVDPGAELSGGVKVWHFCHLMSGCRVGPKTSLGQNVFVAGGVKIGARVKVQNNVSLYKGVIIGDEVFIGPSVVFTNVINPRAFIERKAEYRSTYVERGATIGANATIVCGNRIGAYALVGAGAVVTKDVPAYALVVGNPARRIGWVSRGGERLRFTHPQPLPMLGRGEGPTPGPSLPGRGEGPDPTLPTREGEEEQGLVATDSHGDRYLLKVKLDGEGNETGYYVVPVDGDAE